MSTPTMKGFTQVVPYEYAEILDSDDRAFNLGVVEPGGSVSNNNGFWYNLGYAYLYNGQLSLVVGGTLDKGADADTIDKMLIRSVVWATEHLGYGEPATANNTAGWNIPLPDPFRPFIDYFRGGVYWAPPSGATTGIIRKCFQWDGSYSPDTWDFIYYPLGNGYCPDSAYLTDPFTSVISGTSQVVETDGSCDSGFRLTNQIIRTALSGIEYKHYQAGDPWFDSTDNATGYVISHSGKPVSGVSIVIDDGTYRFTVNIGASSVTGSSSSGFTADWSYASAFSGSYNKFDIIVQGTSFELYINDTLRASATLNVASSAKLIDFMVVGTNPTYIYYTNYIKYYLGGNSIPIT